MAVALREYNSPDQFAREIRRAYAAAEEKLLRRITAKLAAGLDLTNWESMALARIRGLRREVESDVRKLRKLPAEIELSVTRAYDQGAKAAVADLAAAKLLEPGFTPFTTHGSNVKALAAKVSGTLEGAHFQILRTAEDGFRDIIHRTVTLAQSGAMSRRSACQIALNEFADAGVSRFKDIAGRNWSLASYAEMATRTTMAQAAVEGHLQGLSSSGQDLVICSAHSESCPVCEAWEGQVLSITGQTKGYRTVQEATDDGLFHPNCTHSLDPYTPGLTQKMTRREPKTAEGGYEARQKQRHLERQIRKWKNRESVALDETEKARARAKVKAWQGKMREFISETGRRRDRAREQLGAAR